VKRESKEILKGGTVFMFNSSGSTSRELQCGSSNDLMPIAPRALARSRPCFNWSKLWSSHYMREI